MKVKELMKKLEELNPESEVLIEEGCNCGERCGCTNIEKFELKFLTGTYKLGESGDIFVHYSTEEECIVLNAG